MSSYVVRGVVSYTLYLTPLGTIEMAWTQAWMEVIHVCGPLYLRAGFVDR